MRPSDKLIRQKCPACRSEITLGSSSLNKKIQCPKCRKAVIIAGGPPALEEPASSHVTIRRGEFALPPEMAMGMPLASPVPVTAELQPAHVRFSPEEAPAPGEHFHEEKEPVVYCLCNGVLKKRVISKEWGPAKSVCCLSTGECPLDSLDTAD